MENFRESDFARDDRRNSKVQKMKLNSLLFRKLNIDAYYVAIHLYYVTHITRFHEIVFGILKEEHMHFRHIAHCQYTFLIRYKKLRIYEFLRASM